MQKLYNHLLGGSVGSCTGEKLEDQIMKKIIFVLFLLSSSAAYTVDPYIKMFYKGGN